MSFIFGAKRRQFIIRREFYIIEMPKQFNFKQPEISMLDSEFINKNYRKMSASQLRSSLRAKSAINSAFVNGNNEILAIN